MSGSRTSRRQQSKTRKQLTGSPATITDRKTIIRHRDGQRLANGGDGRTPQRKLCRDSWQLLLCKRRQRMPPHFPQGEAPVPPSSSGLAATAASTPAAGTATTGSAAASLRPPLEPLEPSEFKPEMPTMPIMLEPCVISVMLCPSAATAGMVASADTPATPTMPTPAAEGGRCPIGSISEEP